MKFNGTKLPAIRQTVLTIIKPVEVLKFSKQQKWLKVVQYFSLKCPSDVKKIRSPLMRCYVVDLDALTLGSLKYLPLSPAVALDLLHTFVVKILLAQCYGPVVSSQAQQQGEDLNKEIMFAHEL